MGDFSGVVQTSGVWDATWWRVDGTAPAVRLAFTSGQGLLLMAAETGDLLRVAGVDAVSALTVVTHHRPSSNEPPIPAAGAPGAPPLGGAFSEVLAVQMKGETVFLIAGEGAPTAGDLARLINRHREAGGLPQVHTGLPVALFGSADAAESASSGKPRDYGRTLRELSRALSSRHCGVRTVRVKTGQTDSGSIGMTCKQIRGVGLVVLKVGEGSAAETAEVEVSSVVVSIAGKEVKQVEEVRQRVLEMRDNGLEDFEIALIPPSHAKKRTEMEEEMAALRVDVTVAKAAAAAAAVAASRQAEAAPAAVSILDPLSRPPTAALIAYEPAGSVDRECDAMDVVQARVALERLCGGQVSFFATSSFVVGTETFQQPLGVTEQAPPVPAPTAADIGKVLAGTGLALASVADAHVVLCLLGGNTGPDGGFALRGGGGAPFTPADLFEALRKLPASVSVTVLCDTDSCMGIVPEVLTPPVDGLQCRVTIVGATATAAAAAAARRGGGVPSGRLLPLGSVATAYVAAHNVGRPERFLNYLSASLPKKHARVAIAANYLFQEVPDSQTMTANGWCKTVVEPLPWVDGDLEGWCRNFYEAHAPERLERVPNATRYYAGIEPRCVREMLGNYINETISDADVAEACELLRVFVQDQSPANTAALKEKMGTVSTKRGWLTILKDYIHTYHDRSIEEEPESARLLYEELEQLPEEAVNVAVSHPLRCRGVMYMPDNAEVSDDASDPSMLSSDGKAPAVDAAEFAEFQAWREAGSPTAAAAAEAAAQEPEDEEAAAEFARWKEAVAAGSFVVGPNERSGYEAFREATEAGGRVMDPDAWAELQAFRAAQADGGVDEALSVPSFAFGEEDGAAAAAAAAPNLQSILRDTAGGGGDGGPVALSSAASSHLLSGGNYSMPPVTEPDRDSAASEGGGGGGSGGPWQPCVVALSVSKDGKDMNTSPPPPPSLGRGSSPPRRPGRSGVGTPSAARRQQSHQQHAFSQPALSNKHFMELLADDITEAEGLLLGGPADEVVRAPSPQRLARRQPEDDDLSIPRHQHRYGTAAQPSHPPTQAAFFPATDAAPRTGAAYADRQHQQVLFGTPAPSSPHPVDLSLPPPFCHVPAATTTRRTQSPRVTPAPPAVPVQQQQQPRPPHSGGVFDAYGGTPQRSGGRAAAAPASLLLYDALGGGGGGSQHPLAREETALDELFLLGAAESAAGGGSVHPAAAASQQGASPMSSARGERRTVRRSVSPQRPQQSQGGGGGGGSFHAAGVVEDDAGGRAGSVLSMADEFGAVPQTRPSVPATFFRQQARMSHPEL